MNIKILIFLVFSFNFYVSAEQKNISREVVEKWISVTANCQNMGLATMRQDIAPNAEYYEEYLKKINEGLKFLVLNGELEKKKVAIEYPGDIDSFSELVIKDSSVLSEKYGIFLMNELLGMGDIVRFPKPKGLIIIELYLPNEEMVSYLSLLKEKKIFIKFVE